jgi:hypothetical protein
MAYNYRSCFSEPSAIPAQPSPKPLREGLMALQVPNVSAPLDHLNTQVPPPGTEKALPDRSAAERRRENSMERV